MKYRLDEELSLAEMARRLGSKPGSIYTQFQRGIRLLRERVAEEMASSRVRIQPRGSLE